MANQHFSFSGKNHTAWNADEHKHTHEKEVARGQGLMTDRAGPPAATAAMTNQWLHWHATLLATGEQKKASLSRVSSEACQT